MKVSICFVDDDVLSCEHNKTCCMCISLYVLLPPASVNHLGLSHKSGDGNELARGGQLDPAIGPNDAAGALKRQIMESEHLMKALLEQKDGLARQIYSALQATHDFISTQTRVRIWQLTKFMLPLISISLLNQFNLL